MKKVLVIDDDENICISLEFALEDIYRVYSAQDTMKGLAILKEKQIDIVLLDLKIGSHDGIEILKNILAINRNIPVIIMTAYGSIKSSVEAIRIGAFHYITKPIEIEELKIYMQKALEYVDLNNKIKILSDRLHKKNEYDGIIGKSPKMQEIFHIIEKVKNLTTSVLITGESGTGKELVARAIHYGSTRKDHHFEAINCSAIPAHLLESEFFGFKKGAFTGASEDRKGKFELCNNGTIFLDEIGDMDISLQSKLLRFLQDKEVMPLGSNKRTKVDVRVIAATNKNLEKAIAEGKFREDLYYRLNVVTIKMPPLRERKEDIPLLIYNFINKYNNNFSKNIKGIDAQSLKKLENYSFKGNVRELENIIERAVAFCDTDTITVKDLPNFTECQYDSFTNPLDLFIGKSLAVIEKEIILETLKRNNYKRIKTANDLGITERTLRNKLHEYGVRGK